MWIERRSPEVLAGRNASRIRREERRLARELARQHTAEQLAPLQKMAPPDWLTRDGADAYAAELARLYRRLAPVSRARAASA